MKIFEEKIKKFQYAQNSRIGLKYLFLFLLVAMLFFGIFFAVTVTIPNQPQVVFYLALTSRVFLACLALFAVMQANKKMYSRNDAAKFLDWRNSDKNDTFQNALELQQDSAGNDPEILELIFNQADQKAEKQDLKSSASILKPFWLPLTVIVLASTLLYGINWSAFLKAADLFSLTKMPAKQHKEFVEVEPGNISLLKNSKLEIKVLNPELDVPHKLLYRYEESWREVALPSYEKTFDNSDKSFDYFIKTPYAVSDTFRVELFELPAVKEISVRYDYPSYTGLKNEFEQNASGNIKAVSGTEITLNISANNPIESADIIYSNSKYEKMQRMGASSFQTKFVINENLNYHFKLLDVLGNESQKISKSIVMIPDALPEVEIIYPGRDTLLSQNMLLNMRTIASDDFGLDRILLHYHVNEGLETTKGIKQKIGTTTLNFDYIFDLNETFLLPGDKVTYWLEVFDNSPQKQSALSKKYQLRFPSIEEIYDEIAEEETKKSDMLQDALKESEELQKEFEEKRREMMKKDELDWEDKKELEKFMEKQENLSEQVQQLAEDYQQLKEKFEENKALSQETLDKMEKIQELMEQISNEELREAMKEMQEKMENMNPEDMQKAMEDFKFSMEDFAEKLEQTIQMLEDIKKEQTLQKALEIAEEMEEMQSDLNQRTEEGKGENEDLAKEQKKIADKMDSLQEELQKMEEMLDPGKDGEMQDEMDKLQEQMEQDSLKQEMQEAAENLENNDKKKAQAMQQSAKQKMQEMKKQLSKMQQMMQGGMQMDMGEIMQTTIRRLLIFSQRHRNLIEFYNKDPYEILPDIISDFEGITLSLNELYQTPMIMLVLGPKFIYDANYTNSQYREMFQYINDAKYSKVKTYLKNILKGMNLMIYDLVQSSNNMQGGGGGGGMESLMQSMQQMGQQQMGMNMMTQGLMQQMMQEGGKLGNQGRKDAQKLAADEKRLAENLKRLLQNNPEAQKQTSALNRIVEDLEDIAKKLERGAISQELVDKQERILSRLLDVQKSVHKREFSKKRKSEISDIEDWELPEDVKLKFQRMRRKALLNEDYKNYPKEYQELIKEYLKLLNEKAERNGEE